MGALDERWPDAPALAAASLAEVLGQWQGLGYPRRARTCTLGAFVANPDGRGPVYTAGAGPHIADAVRCFAREQPALPMDVNVRRASPSLRGAVSISQATRGRPAGPDGLASASAPRPRLACPVRHGCAGPDAGDGDAVPARRQKRFEGSVRQHRGRLLRRVLAEGAIAVEGVEAEIAAGLASDGLAVLADGWLRAPV